jgi:hypothetical protein
MNLDQWKKACLVAAIGSGLMLASATAQAQSVNVGSNVNIDLGKDVKAAHADQVGVGMQGANINANVAAADGLRVGETSLKAGVQGSASVPAAAVAAALAD